MEKKTGEKDFIFCKPIDKIFFVKIGKIIVFVKQLKRFYYCKNNWKDSIVVKQLQEFSFCKTI